MPILRVLKTRTAPEPHRSLWHFDHFTWMVNMFGSPHLPKVPTVLQRFEPLCDTAYSEEDSRSPADWAQDVFARVVADCRMDDWTLSCREAPEGPQDGLHHMPLGRVWHRQAPGAYHVDLLGNPVVLYKPDSLEVPGAFALSVILQLATLRLASAPVPEHYSAEDHARILMGMAVYNGQGFELLGMADMLTDHFCEAGLLQRGEVNAFVNELEYVTVMGMRARSLAPEQMIATYGPSLTRTMRKRIWNLVGELDAYAPEMKLLRHLSNTQPDLEITQATLREVAV